MLEEWPRGKATRRVNMPKIRVEHVRDTTANSIRILTCQRYVREHVRDYSVIITRRLPKRAKNKMTSGYAWH